MKAKEFRSLGDDQLTAAIGDTNKQLFRLKFQAATEKIDAPSELRRLRRAVARMKTIQRARELGKETPVGKAV